MISCFVLGLSCIISITNGIWIDEYNTIWNDPGIGGYGSLPIGNGDLTANVFLNKTETNSSEYDLLLLFDKSDSYDITGERLKLIYLKISLEPAITYNNGSFRETLSYSNATVNIETDNYNIVTYIDINTDTANINVSSKNNQEYTLQATVVTWRPENSFNISQNTGQSMCNDPNWVPIMKDNIMEHGCNNDNSSIMYYHRNYYPNAKYQTQFEYDLYQQGLQSITNIPDPFLNLTWGGVLSIDAGQYSNNIQHTGSTLTISDVTIPTRAYFTFLTQQTKQLSTWMDNLCDTHSNYTPDFASQEKWWHQFWNRSWVMVSATYPNETDITHSVTTKYNAQRYLDALDGRSKSNIPIKFNGQSFYIDDGNGPDYKQWASAFWWQNERQPYYNTHVSGDNEFNVPFYNFYKNQLSLIQQRNKIWFNISGGFFCETTLFTGLVQEGQYGSLCSDEYNQYGIIRWLRYHWVGGLELVNLLLDDYYYNLNDTIITEYAIPIANTIYNHYLGFYDINQTTNKLYLYPSQSLETWQCPDVPYNYSNCAVNPTEQIAGLNITSKRLLDLPSQFGTENDRQLWQKIYNVVPPITLRQVNSQTVIYPAEVIPPTSSNSENTELYTVHPFRLYTWRSNKHDLDVVLNTYNTRRFPCNVGWCQDILDAALLGLTDDAKSMVMKRDEESKDGYPWKFDGFTAHFQDYQPSVDHLEWMRSGLHLMILQENFNDINDNNIYLFPTWPCEWNINIKLHATMNTIIILNYNAVTKEYQLNVMPNNRKSDVVFVNCVS